MSDSAKRIVPVILCGGSGSRLWPVSRETYPKPFVKMKNGRTLFMDTLKRAALIENSARPIIVCNDAHRFYVLETVAQCETEAEIILEPKARNTAPAIALAAFGAARPEDALLVMPSDHAIADPQAFAQAVGRAAQSAADGRIVTFGIEPTRPETGFGYIEKGGALADDCFAVSRFIEKPDAASARRMLDQGGFYWNSGIFLMTAKTYLDELKLYSPEIFRACENAWQGKKNDLAFIRPDEGAFCASPEDSIDYAVMEHTRCAAVCPLNVRWNDLGTWNAFYNEESRDENGNVLLGDVLARDVENCYLHAEDRLLAVLGARDLAVVETRDAVLVVPREKAQQVKKIVASLKEAKRKEYRDPAIVFRPWGKFESLARGPRFQVKKITVRPGGRLSLQMHHHRAEHWVVVKGTAAVCVDDEQSILTENQSVYIPVGSRHKLENPGIIPLEIIEIQSGPYLGEDDIKRFEDIYGRS